MKASKFCLIFSIYWMFIRQTDNKPPTDTAKRCYFGYFVKKTDENIQILPRFVKKLEVYSAR